MAAVMASHAGEDWRQVGNRIRHRGPAPGRGSWRLAAGTMTEPDVRRVAPTLAATNRSGALVKVTVSGVTCA